MNSKLKLKHKMAITGTKKKRVSKKLKISWRKHVDIKDVEDYLEDQRLEERLGPPLSTVPNDELFKLDTKPSLELLSRKERKKLKATKPLKCFSALQPHTKVPDPVKKRNRVRSKEERKNELVKRKELENRIKGKLKSKDIVAEANRRLDELKRQNKPKRGEFNVDIWVQDKNHLDIEQDEWSTCNTKKHNLRGMGLPVKNVRKSVLQKNSPLPAIEPPHPGMSYNPTFEDHQDLLTIVADKETKLIKEEEHLKRCTKNMFQKVSVDKKDESWLVEMSEGLPSRDGTNVEENAAESDNEYRTVNPPAKNVKKTVKQRRKQKDQLELEKLRKAKKLEKNKITGIHKLKILKDEIEKMEKKQSILREKRKEKAELKKNETKVLGPLKFENADLDFVMGQELTGNLKDLKTEGNLLTDRFKSMQKRNILAPTKRHNRKKAKVKKYVKPGHKDEDWKKTVAR